MKQGPEPLTRIGIVGLLVGGVTICAAAQSPAPSRVWSVGPLTKPEQVMGFTVGTDGTTLAGPHIDSQTSSTFSATRSVVFVGDRLALASKIGMRQVPDAKIPVQVYQLLSLDIQTGHVKDNREVTAFGRLMHRKKQTVVNRPFHALSRKADFECYAILQLVRL